jgi:multisubunit Na+/H+ antiporter MnhB subunit
MKKQSGFLQIIFVVIVFVLVVLILGKNPVEIWSQYIEPLFLWSLNIFVKIISFLITLATNLLS